MEQIDKNRMVDKLLSLDKEKVLHAFHRAYLKAKKDVPSIQPKTATAVAVDMLYEYGEHYGLQKSQHQNLKMVIDLDVDKVVYWFESHGERFIKGE